MVIKTNILLAVFFLARGSWASPVSKIDVDYTSMYLAQFPKQDFPDDIPAEILREPENVRVDPSNVRVFFYSKSASNGVQVNLSNVDSVKKAGYSSSENSVFVIHGWQNSHTTEMSQTVKNAYVSATSYNVFVIDWNSIAMLDYITAKGSVSSLGHILGSMISTLVKSNLLSLEKTSIVGHSLGAHFAGNAGKALNGQVDHIVGLDPAGPLYSLQNSGERIARSDAKFVQIIHTNAGTLGFDGNLGASDYWPNGGHTQPGCIADLAGTCSHGRSFEYYAESVKSGNFKAWKCNSYDAFDKGNCHNGQTSYVGQLSVDKSANGVYYLHTNSHSPYAKGNGF